MTRRRPCARHTKCPSGYFAKYEWAERKMKTHDQVQCPDCGLWAIWVKRPKGGAMRDDVTVDEWVAALESGEYQHGKGRLCQRETVWKSPGGWRSRSQHCCLGVLLDLAGAEWSMGLGDEVDSKVGALHCVDIGSTTEIPVRRRRQLGPEIEAALGRLIPNPLHEGKMQVAHDVLANMNDLSVEGYRPAVEVLRRMQEAKL